MIIASYSDKSAFLMQLKARYSDKLNFVMLNIENSRWLPEMAEYRVSGVPHFVFLDNQGRAQAATIGRLPKEVITHYNAQIVIYAWLRDAITGIAHKWTEYRCLDKGAASTNKHCLPKRLCVTYQNESSSS